MQRPAIRVGEQYCPLRCHRGDSGVFSCMKADADRRSDGAAKRAGFLDGPEAN